MSATLRRLAVAVFSLIPMTVFVRDTAFGAELAGAERAAATAPPVARSRASIGSVVSVMPVVMDAMLPGPWSGEVCRLAGGPMDRLTAGRCPPQSAVRADSLCGELSVPKGAALERE